MKISALFAFTSVVALSLACTKESRPDSASAAAPVQNAPSSVAPAACAAPTVSAAPVASAVPTPSAPPSLETQPGKCDEGRKATTASVSAVQVGTDVRVTVKDYMTYCTSDAKYSVTKDADTLHITGSKPSSVSRCVCAHELGFVVHGVLPGSYKISFEETPYAVDAAAVKTIATGSVALVR